jgi:hypothetical protein
VFLNVRLSKQSHGLVRVITVVFIIPRHQKVKNLKQGCESIPSRVFLSLMAHGCESLLVFFYDSEKENIHA